MMHSKDNLVFRNYFQLHSHDLVMLLVETVRHQPEQRVSIRINLREKERNSGIRDFALSPLNKSLSKIPRKRHGFLFLFLF
jgi:hypothetical protein